MAARTETTPPARARSPGRAAGSRGRVCDDSLWHDTWSPSRRQFHAGPLAVLGGVGEDGRRPSSDGHRAGQLLRLLYSLQTCGRPRIRGRSAQLPPESADSIRSARPDRLSGDGFSAFAATDPTASAGVGHSPMPIPNPRPERSLSPCCSASVRAFCSSGCSCSLRMADSPDVLLYEIITAHIAPVAAFLIGFLLVASPLDRRIRAKSRFRSPDHDCHPRLRHLWRSFCTTSSTSPFSSRACGWRFGS